MRRIVPAAIPIRAKKSRPANGTAEKRIETGSARGAFSASLAAERVSLHLAHKLIVDGRLQPIF